MSFEELIRRLRAEGVDPDARAIADAVWLAQWVKGSPAADEAPGDAASWAPRGWRPGSVTASEEEHAERLARLDVPRVAPPRHVPPAGLLSPDSRPGLLDLQRALRPLQRHRAGSRSTTTMLDEEATAELRASTGITVPVFAGTTRRSPTATLQLLFDSSSSMVVWEETAEELAQVFAQIGAFRDVRRHRLHQADDGTLLVATGQGAGLRPRPAWSALDPTRRTFTVLISDCAGPIWRSGIVQRFLHRLAAQRSPVVVLQPLPQRLWPRTALMPGPGLIHLRGQDGLECAFIPDDPPAPSSLGALPVPVLPPSSQALGRWARLLTGKTPTSVRGAAAWVRRDHPPVPAEAGRPRAAHELMDRFRADASPTAQRLAVYLAAAPLTLPLMQLVQQVMLKGESGPRELAEVLLGGILSHANPAGTRGETWYDFAPGVQDLLLERLTRDEAELVLKHCSDYVERQFGRGSRNFPALALTQISRTDASAALPPSSPGHADETAHVPPPFAAISAKVVRRFTPDLVPPRLPSGEVLAQARELVSGYERERDGWALVTAVQLLQDLTDRPRPGAEPGEAEGELAGALLALYRLEGDPDLLDGSRHAVQLCLGRPERPAAAWEGTARLTYGRVRREDARRRQTAGDRGGAEVCLEDADREFEQATWQLAPDTLPGLQAVLERADVLHELWRLNGDQALLYEAAGALRAIGGAQSFWAPHTADLRLQLGRVLLDIARTAGDRAPRYAAEAARELALAREVLAAEPDGPTRMTALLLDLATARELGGEDGTVILQTLEEAERAAEFAPDPEMRARAALHLARTHRARFETGHDLSALRQVSAAFDLASDHLRGRDRERAAVLEEWGETLLALAGPEEGTVGEAVTTAIDVLGHAVRDTPGSDPAVVRRRLLLGRAFHLRFLGSDDIGDLQDAVHTLDRAARAEGPPEIVARAWYELGGATRELAWRSRNFALLHEAVAHLHQAVQEARRAGDAALGALAEAAYQELRPPPGPPG